MLNKEGQIMKTVNVGDITYEQLQEEAMQFLARCGQLTLLEHIQQGVPAKTSANEILGMATRLIAEQARNIQALADEEEPNG
jgi:hypothetical protein